MDFVIRRDGFCLIEAFGTSVKVFKGDVKAFRKHNIFKVIERVQ